MKKNILIIFLICIICLLSALLISKDFKLRNTSNENIKNVEEDNKQEENYDKILESLVGDWGRCDAEYECYGILFIKEGIKYNYASYYMWSEGGEASPISKIEKINDDTYKISAHFDAYQDDMIQYDEHDVVLTIDVSKIKDEIINVNDKEYKKVVGERDTFYRNLF